MDKQTRPSVGVAAWRACLAHPGEVAALAAQQVLARLLALLPLLLPGRFLPAWAAYLLAGLMVCLLVLPARFRAGEQLRYCSAPRQEKPRGGRPCLRWLRSGLARGGLGCLWGLPFLSCVGYFLYGKANLPFNAMWMPVQQLARLRGREPGLAAGLPVAGALVAVFAALFAYGWWRLLPMEYLPVRHLGWKKSRFFCHRARVRGRGALVNNTLVNALLTLPALAGFTVVLGRYVLSRISLSSSPELILASFMRLMRQPLPREEVVALAGVFFLLYLPLAIYRKMRCAVVVRRLTKECSGLEKDHAAG